MLDPAAHTDLERFTERGWGIVVTSIGIIFFSMVIGLVVDAVNEKCQGLKKGLSAVVAKKHTCILGFSDRIYSLVTEIALANESEGGGVVTVLANRDKEEMEADIFSRIDESQLLGTKVVCRTGDPMIRNDLMRVSASSARCIIVLSEGAEVEKADSTLMRVIMNVRSIPCQLEGHIVAEVRDGDNEALVTLVGDDCVESIVSHDILGRLMVMSARHPGVAAVFASILGFDGDEFYMKAWNKRCMGLQFHELQYYFADAIVIGVRKNSDGTILLQPDWDYVIQKNDQILVIAEDDDSYKPTRRPVDVPADTIPKEKKPEVNVEQTLMIGWRRDVIDIIFLMDNFQKKGSVVHLLNETPVAEREKELLESGLDVKTGLVNISFVHHVGSSIVRRNLDMIDFEKFTSIMILADEKLEEDTQESDSHNITTLLLIKDIINRRFEAGLMRRMPTTRITSYVDADIHYVCGVVCELLDPSATSALSAAEALAGFSDYVQSNEMISQLMAMVSEDRGVANILDELLGPRGATFCVFSGKLYCSEDEELDFYTMWGRCRARNQILVGYQDADEIDVNTYINPRNKLTKMNWYEVEMVVLAKIYDNIGGDRVNPRFAYMRKFEELIEAKAKKENTVRKSRKSVRMY